MAFQFSHAQILRIGTASARARTAARQWIVTPAGRLETRWVLRGDGAPP